MIPFRPSHPPSQAPCRGFSLLEVMAAMVVLGVSLIFLTQVLVQEAFVERRTSTQVAALRLLEAHSEILRAGYPLPDVDGEYSMELLVAPAADDLLDDPALRLELRELTPSGLWRADLVLAYRVGGEPRTQRLEMRLWRP